MAFKLGSTAINKAYLGATEINKMMLGSTKVFSASSGTVPYKLSGASYDDVSLSTSGTVSQPTGITFGDNDNKFYVSTYAGTIYQYEMTVAGDLSTASYASKSVSVSAQAGTALDVFLSTDGTKMYVSDLNDDLIYQYTLSTAWDVSTAGYDSKSLATTEDTDPRAFVLKGDGTKLYMLGNASNTVYQYTLSTAWDVSTATYDSVSYSVPSGTLVGMTISADGLYMFIGDFSGNIFQHDMSSAWDLSTASDASISLAGEGQANGITFTSDGTSFLTVAFTAQTIYQYSTGAA